MSHRMVAEAEEWTFVKLYTLSEIHMKKPCRTISYANEFSQWETANNAIHTWTIANSVCNIMQVPTMSYIPFYNNFEIVWKKVIPRNDKRLSMHIINRKHPWKVLFCTVLFTPSHRFKSKLSWTQSLANPCSWINSVHPPIFRVATSTLFGHKLWDCMVA